MAVVTTAGAWSLSHFLGEFPHLVTATAFLIVAVQMMSSYIALPEELLYDILKKQSSVIFVQVGY